MPARPDFFHRYAPKPEHDVRLLVTRTEVVTAAGQRRVLHGFETEQQAKEWRLKRVAILRKGSRAERELADKLDACGDDDAWCLSPACPPCARAYRVWLCGETLRLLAPIPNRRLRFTTLVMPKRRIARGKLHRLDAKAALATLKRQLERAPLPRLVLVGGLDLGLEIDRLNVTPTAWQLHVHVITAGHTDGELKLAAKPYYPATKLVPKPMRVDPVGDRARQLTYCYKNYYQRYVRELDGDNKPTRNRYPLNDAEWREVLRFLDRHSFNELTILKGVRRHGSQLRFTAGAVAEKTGLVADKAAKKANPCRGIANRSQGEAGW